MASVLIACLCKNFECTLLFSAITYYILNYIELSILRRGKDKLQSIRRGWKGQRLCYRGIASEICRGARELERAAFILQEGCVISVKVFNGLLSIVGRNGIML